MAARKEKIRTQWDAVDNGTLHVPCSYCDFEISFAGRNDCRLHLRCGRCGKLTKLTEEAKMTAATHMLQRIKRTFG